MAHERDERPSTEPEAEGPVPLVQFVQAMSAEEMFKLDALAELDRANPSDADELAEFKRTHDGMSPGEWLRRRAPSR